MQKLDMKTAEITEENIDKLAAIFPHCITEVKEKDGTVTRGVDFNLLKQEFSNAVVDGPRESYSINWPGKKASLVSANTPIDKTLRPCREESVNFDTTENLYIEGDNLEALKLLQESYLGKVKMIYIDPPYNTGKDFVYKDNYTRTEKEELEESGQRDKEGGRLVANLESNGRYHSDWLNMIYPRLKLSRSLLKEDGVIFISLDDGEIANLRRICDEIFGEDNFIATFIWEKRTNRENRKVVSVKHDYILCYTKIKNPEKKALKQLPMNEKALANYKNPDNDERGPWKSDPATAQSGHATKSQFYELVAPNGKIHTLESGRCWLYNQDSMTKAIGENRIWFGKDGNGVPRVKTYLHAKERGLTPETIFYAKEVNTTEIAKNHIKNLFDGKAVFETPKPVQLLEIFSRLCTTNDLVLDFFSGSATLAHAILQLNAEDNSNRKFILVQLPEETDEESEAYKAGYNTISEIGKERIRRAGKKIKEENASKEGIRDLDVGFRVLKIDSSNMKDIYYTPDSLGQKDIDFSVSNVKEDRTSEDLLFQVLLDWGVDLTLPIKVETIENKEVYFVDEDTLAACFEDDLSEELVKELAARKVMRVVFKESGFVSDELKINVDQIFAQLSPDTEVRGI